MLFARHVCVYVVLAVHQLFRFLNGYICLDPSLGATQHNLPLFDAARDEPITDRVNCFVTRRERTCNVCWGPIFSVVWRFRMRDVVEVISNVFDISLFQCESQWNG